ncbi:MAG TPA: sensor histidine kinase [Actinomycetota bacterium]|nr:sensor histidine kinase [Actinomycetota bacterium]
MKAATLRTLWHPLAPTDEPRLRAVGLVIAGLALLVAIGNAVVRNEFSPPGTALVLGLIAFLPWAIQAAGIAVPRLLFVGVVLIASLALVLSAPSPDKDISPFFLVLLAGEVGATLSWRSSAGVAAACLVVASFCPCPGQVVMHHAPWYFGILFGWLGGMSFQSQQNLLTQLHEAQADLAEKAVLEERSRIAREVHDVVAHSLTVTMLHVTGARRALQRDPEEAMATLEKAERLGRQSLADVKRSVGLLGTEGDSELSPSPGAEDLPKLIDDLSMAGMDVTFDVEGDPASLSPGTGLALFRIVQEALTNAAKHAGGRRVDISLKVADSEVAVTVRNPAPGQEHAATPGSGGHGLWGMDQRASALGGTFAAGADDGEWVVSARLPTVGADS